MVAKGPPHRPPAHRDAAQDNALPCSRGAPHLPRQDGRRRRHDHLEAVLRLGFRVEEQNVLRARADIDCQNTHVVHSDYATAACLTPDVLPTSGASGPPKQRKINKVRCLSNNTAVPDDV